MFFPRLLHVCRWWLPGLLVLVAGLAGPARASHIVGGQLGMDYLSAGRYRLNLTLYFDVVNGMPTALDSSVTVAVYAKDGNALEDFYTLPLVRRSPVVYTSPNCPSAPLVTDELRYSVNATFSPDRYTDPAGYYMVWERCCRNAIINNIAAPGATGQTFYLEFPPMRRPNGQPFVDSAPRNFLPSQEYACIGQPFQVAFGGTDPDGDSLAYELAVPLAGHANTGNNLPFPPEPAPYQRVSWEAGFDSLNQIPGPAPLRVDPRTGGLSFTAGSLGLHVFSIKCSEYRRGVKIGEVRREFQQMVVNCRPTVAPVLHVTPPGPAGTGPILPARATILLPPPGAPGGRCLNVYASDPDSLTTLQLRVVVLGALQPAPQLLVTGGAINAPGRPDSLVTQLCFSPCFNPPTDTAQVLLIAEDNTCPRSGTDTVWLTVVVQRSAAYQPRVQASSGAYVYSVEVGRTLRFGIEGVLADQAPVTVAATNLTTAPLRAFPIQCRTVTAPGLASTRVIWPVGCTVPPGTYTLRFRASAATSECPSVTRADTAVRVTVLPASARPRPLLRVMPSADTLRVRSGETATFDLRAFSPDSAFVFLTAANLAGEPLRRFPIQCPPAAARYSAATRLTWPIDCSVPPGTYRLVLRATVPPGDCRAATLTDTTVLVRVLAEAPFDEQPANVITPDGDHRNDVFAPAPPTGCQAAAFRRLRLYNRWGRQVFSTTDPATGWDGAGCSAGTYYYLVEYADRVYKGWVELIR